ncbi:flavodoxin domain-containing protein [Cellulomonas endophytica]|uniref:flavodoxin domain-containing protein n=1 Tax=Cellulomonas endophytica TaxID=2494735 RepID=UPI001012273D|nr:flavodoxin domain-containing protein [Cellulomonas endophytica]
MRAQVLVAVASRHGGTWGIGEVVSATLAEAGHGVDLLAPEDVADVGPYGAVVLGSAVYLAHWLPAARDLAERHADALRERPVWLLSSGLATQPAAAANSPHELAALRERLGARGHRSFRGRLDRRVLTFAERAVIAGGRAREGDHRDLAAVAEWARGIAATLADEAVHRPADGGTGTRADGRALLALGRPGRI